MSLAANYSIAAIFSAKDKLTPVTDKISKNYKSFGGKVQRSMKKIGGAMKSVLKIGAAAALGATIAFTTLAVNEFINLDEAVTQAGAKFKDLNTTSQDYGATLDALSDKAREVGSVTEFSATDAAGALDKMAMAGLSSEVSMSLLMGTTNLATAANTDLTTAVDIATDTMGAFGLSMDNAADAEKNLARVSDVMAKTTTTANTDLNLLFESVKNGAASFTAAGQTIETFSAAAGIMANAGIKGGEAGTSLRNVMLRLAKPTGEAATLLKKLGVETADSDGNFRDMVDILADMESGLEGMGSQQRSAALATIFGARTVTGINTLLAAGSDQLREYRGTLEDSAGASKQMAEAMRGSLKNQIAVLKSSVTELGLQFVESFEKDGRGALQGLIDLTQKIDMSGMAQFNALLKEGIGATMEWLRPLLDAVVGGWQRMFESFRDTGQLEKFIGVAKGLLGPMTTLKNVIVDMYNSLSTFLVDSGIMKVLVSTFRLLGATFRTAANMLKLFWNIAQPIFNLLGKILKPIMSAIAGIIDGVAKIEELRGSAVGAIAGVFGEEGAERREGRRDDRAERRAERRQDRIALAPNSAEVESQQAQMLRGEGTITVKAEDGTEAQVDTGTMPDAGWDMTALGRDSA